MAKRNVDITKEGDQYVFKHRNSGKEIVRTPSEERRDAYALSIRRKSRNTIDVHHLYKRSFEEYYYDKKKKLTEDDKEKKKDNTRNQDDKEKKRDKIRDDGGRILGPLDEDKDPKKHGRKAKLPHTRGYQVPKPNPDAVTDEEGAEALRNLKGYWKNNKGTRYKDDK